MSNKKTIFLTGATGLIGSYLLKIFLENDYKVYALCRRKNGKSAEKRTIELLDFWNGRKNIPTLDNLKILEGDITRKDLSLSRKAKNLIIEEIDEIFHSAAITEINRLLNEVRRVNVEGTKNVLDLAIECSKKGKLKKVNHLSTAYICGKYKNTFKETDLDVGQKFNSTYEQSKFEAEEVVEEYRKKDLWIDIFRPAIVVGELATGKIFRFRNVYNFIHLCELGIFNTLPVLDSYISLVPVDIVAKIICEISKYSKEKNRNFHTFPKERISLEDILNKTSAVMGFKKPKAVSIDKFNLNKITSVQRAILRNSIFSVNLDAKFDTTYTANVLEKYGFNIPQFNEQTFLTIVKYFANEKYVNQMSIK